MAALVGCLSGAPTPAVSAESLHGWLRPGSRAAVGLGGDPFLSSMDDASGWWQEADPGPSAGVRLDLHGIQTITERATGGRGRVDRLVLSSRVSGRKSILGRQSAFAVRISNPSWGARWSADTGRLGINGEGADGTLSLRLLDLFPGVTLQASHSSRFRSDGPKTNQHAVGVRWRPSGWLAAQAAWQRGAGAGLLYSTLEGDDFAASVNPVGEGVRWDARIGLPLGFSAEASSGFRSVACDESRDPRRRWQVFPAGADNWREAALAWTGPRGLRCLVRRAWGDGDWSADAAAFGQRFGRVSYASGSLRSTLVAVELSAEERSRLLLERESVRADSRARADVELWPFTDALIDLLGPRRIYRGAAEASWIRWHLAGERKLGRRALGRAGITWVGVHGSGHLESWRPAFLVFGRSDYKRHPLAYSGADLVSVSLGLVYSMSWAACELGLEQIAYARAERAFDRSGGGGEGGDGGAPGTAGRTSWIQRLPGGSELTVRLVRSW